jgi:hypothetical protein
MDDTEVMEEEIIIRETAAVIGIFALSQAVKHRQRPKRRIWSQN